MAHATPSWRGQLTLSKMTKALSDEKYNYPCDAEYFVSLEQSIFSYKEYMEDDK